MTPLLVIRAPAPAAAAALPSGLLVVLVALIVLNVWAMWRWRAALKGWERCLDNCGRASDELKRTAEVLELSVNYNAALIIELEATRRLVAALELEKRAMAVSAGEA